MLGLHKVLNKIFRNRCLTVLLKAVDPEYARVLNMLGLHMVLNKVLRNGYLGRF